MTKEEKKQLEEWNPETAQMRGELKAPVDLHMKDLPKIKEGETLTFEEPEIKKKKKKKAKVVDLKPKNKNAMF